MIETPWPESYKIAPDHCADVLAGCYAVPLSTPSPIVLDLGANVGAFLRWVVHTYPTLAEIHCFEPCLDNFDRLQRTKEQLIPMTAVPKVHLHNQAVWHETTHRPLYAGPYNCGEYSLCGSPHHDMESPEMVLTIDAAILPLHHLLKIDTEGAEMVILERMIQAGRLAHTQAIVLEWHHTAYPAMLTALLDPQGFRLHERVDHEGSRGVMKFVRP